MSHFIRFYSGEGAPRLLFWEGEQAKVSSLELSGRQDMVFSDRRACIGFRSPEGYCACRNRAINVRQCPACAFQDMAKAYTVGDFSGYPQLYEQAKQEEYVLYLAGFGEDIIKCGVTRKERFESRMREQGADFGCVVAVHKGPDGIYGAESSLQGRFGFANSVRLEQKMRRLVFDRQAAFENFKSSVELVRASGALPDLSSDIIDLSQHYPYLHSPQRTESILGEILGAKGEILLFKSEGGRQFAVNMRKHVGTFFNI